MTDQQPSSRHTVRLSRRAFLITAALVTTTGAELAADQPAALPRGFGVSVSGSGVEIVRAARAVGAAVGRMPTVINLFVAWQWAQPFPLDTITAIRDFGATPEITWEPWDPRLGLHQTKYHLDNLPAHVDYIDTWAHAAGAYRDTLYLRFAHEMNGDWYPWSAVHTSPREYVTAYRWLRDRVQAAGATNIRWVWCPNVVQPTGDADVIRDCYPGDGAVDVVALDGYSLGYDTPQTLLGDTIDLLESIGPSKPLWINEIGRTTDPAKPAWISECFRFLTTTPVSRIMWFELDTDGHDWRMLANPATTVATRHSLSSW